MNNLYLFDIDATLVNATKAHLTAYQNAYLEVFNKKVADETLYKRFGQAEKEIHLGVCKELGLSYTDSDLERIIKIWEEGVINTINPQSVQLLPGVRECLEYLKPRDKLGVITGNLKRVGEVLLDSNNLADYFLIKSYGDNAEQRVDILKNALSQARDKDYAFDNLIVIGDSPSDIKAGKLVNALTVGVATGYSSRDKLQEFNPNLAIDSLLEYRKIIELTSKS
ncbi:MAG: HAD hydrolase-like protein [Nanoarchaeota archaeon]|nr:HAD hydrolase-like protein [Nanoarchaeota archaeon]